MHYKQFQTLIHNSQFTTYLNSAQYFGGLSTGKSFATCHFVILTKTDAGDHIEATTHSTFHIPQLTEHSAPILFQLPTLPNLPVP